MHAALVTPWGTGGGIANYSKRLRDALDARGIEVTIVPIEHVNTWNPRKFNEIIQSIPSQVDVVHIQYEAGVFGRFGISGICAPLFYAQLAQEDWKIITTLHEVHQDYPNHSTPKAAVVNARDWLFERVILSTSDTAVIHTKNAEAILRNRHGAQLDLKQMRHPVDAPIAPPVDADVARAELNIDAETVLLTFGWIESKKRYQDVVHCLPELPDTTYLIAGEPRHDQDQILLDDVFTLSRQLGVRDRVQHLGYVANKDLPTLFGATDLTVVPYEQVTQSGAVNTSLAYHCPVVTTALPAFEELTNEYECVFTYDDLHSLRDIIRATTMKCAQKQLRTATKRYSDTESWSSFADETALLYGAVDNNLHNKQ